MSANRPSDRSVWRGGLPRLARAGRRRVPALWIAVAVVALLDAAFCGAQPVPEEPPPDLPPEVFRIARGLRCPVCQGESAAESNSGVAREMRHIIAGMLAEGKGEEEIRRFFVDRYGDWILYEPPRRGLTLGVWLAPPVGLALLAYLLWGYVRRAGVNGEASISEEELDRVERELGGGGAP